MTRQSPDKLIEGSSSYNLHAFPPILPPGDPRWACCRFAGGNSTANQRGYGATWLIEGGRLFLKSFGGAVETADPDRRRIQIGIRDVHETDMPVPATWISNDLHCASEDHLGDFFEFKPKYFRSFRIERGLVVADVVLENTQRIVDFAFRYEMIETASVALGEGTTRGRRVGSAPIGGLLQALQADGGAPFRRADLLWHASAADLPDLIAALPLCRERSTARWIAYALGRIGPEAETAIPALLEMLGRSDDQDVLKASAYALAGIGIPAAPALASVVGILEERSSPEAIDQVFLMLERLESLGSGAVGPLVDALLTARERKTRFKISYALGKIGLDAVAPLLAALADARDDDQRKGVACALKAIGSDAAVAIAPLLRELDAAPDGDLRQCLAEAVQTIGIGSATSLGTLRDTFHGTRDERTLQMLAKAMASLGSNAIGPLLEELAVSSSGAARLAIVRALGGIGASAVDAVEPLIAMAHACSDGPLLVGIAETLVKIGAPAVPTASIQIAALRVAGLGYEANAILDRMVPGVVPPDPAVRDLAAMILDRTDSRRTRRIAELLGAIGEPAVEPLLALLPKAQSQETRALITWVLGRIGVSAPDTIDLVLATLKEARSDDVRLRIIDDLRKLGAPSATHVDTLVDVFDQATFAPVLWRLGLVLASIGAPSVNPLVERLKTATEVSRIRAIANAIGEIGPGASDVAPVVRDVLATKQDPEQRHALEMALYSISKPV
ncbi:HEAT repeat domain-containing protein [Methylobacterium brachythecii]|nr:hypothetical protein [Methylobacterium brachythecii]GLS47045.1 hypothetical protein GCM10007884_50460 [Methylobacterium brachythecii]